MASKQARRTLVKRYLRQNPTATNDQVAKALHVSARLVTLARAELALEGVPIRAAGDYTSPFAKTEDGERKAFEVQAAAEFAKAAKAAEAKSGRPITLDEQVEILSRMIRDPMASPQVVGGLISVLQRIKPEAKSQVGPPEPLGFEGRVKRLSLLIQACGLEVTQSALLSAGFTGKIAPLERNPDEKPLQVPPEPGSSPAQYLEVASILAGRDPEGLASPRTEPPSGLSGGETEGQGGSEELR